MIPCVSDMNSPPIPARGVKSLPDTCGLTCELMLNKHLTSTRGSDLLLSSEGLRLVPSVDNSSSSYFTQPIHLAQSQTSWLWKLPLKPPRGPTSHLVPPLVPCSLAAGKRGAGLNPQTGIDLWAMRYVTGLGSGLTGPATAVSHNSSRCWDCFYRLQNSWKYN